jgi:hypothetical protein
MTALIHRPARPIRPFLISMHTPEKRIANVRETAGLLSDQFALLRTLGGNVNEALTRGPGSLDERKRIAGLLDECIGEMGKLIAVLNGSAK